jgi:hypothetical protein
MLGALMAWAGPALAQSEPPVSPPGPAMAQEEAQTAGLNHDISAANSAADQRYADQKKQYDAARSANDAALSKYQDAERQYQEQKAENDRQQQDYQDKLKAYQEAIGPK